MSSRGCFLRTNSGFGFLSRHLGVNLRKRLLIGNFLERNARLLDQKAVAEDEVIPGPNFGMNRLEFIG